jgi:hypothetical protein
VEDLLLLMGGACAGMPTATQHSAPYEIPDMNFGPAPNEALKRDQ